MPGRKKLVEEFFFPKTNCFYSLWLLKTTVGLSEKKFARWLFHAWHKFASLQEHIFHYPTYNFKCIGTEQEWRHTLLDMPTFPFSSATYMLM